MKQITLIVPIALPGFGKSLFNEKILKGYFEEINQVQQNKISFVSLCNDEIRQDLVDTYLANHPNESKEKDFLATSPMLQGKIEESLLNEIERQVDQDGQNIEQQVIYLDKNHSPSLLLRLKSFLE